LSSSSPPTRSSPPDVGTSWRTPSSARSSAFARAIPLDVGGVELLIVDGLPDDQPLDLRERETEARRHHLLDVPLGECHRETALRQVRDRRPDQRLDLVPSGRLERPRQREPLELVRDRGIRTGDQDRLPGPLGHRELLQVPDHDGIIEVRTKIVEHVDRRRLELTDEREGLLRLLRIDLRGVGVTRQAERHRPRPHRVAAELRRAARERHEPRLVVHPRDDQRMAGRQEQTKIADPVHRPRIIAGSRRG
jgi:hypothetical protein